MYFPPEGVSVSENGDFVGCDSLPNAGILVSTALIDFFTPFDGRRKIERAALAFVTFNQANITAKPPLKYKERLMEFLKTSVFVSK